MVSYPTPSNALTLRGGPPPPTTASSVITSSSSRRSHRHDSTTSTRSHHHHARRAHTTGGRSLIGGGREASAEKQSRNEFPVFENSGDVEILIKAGGRTNRYLLHRVYLERCSAWFEEGEGKGGPYGRARLTSQLVRVGHGNGNGNEKDDGSGMGSLREETLASSREGGSKIRWRYELERSSRGDGNLPMLIQTDASSSPTTTSSFLHEPKPPPVPRNKPSSTAGAHPSFFRSVANLSLLSHHSHHSSSASSTVPPNTTTLPPLNQSDADLLTAYDNLFRTFYNYAPALSSSDIATAYIQCKTLLLLASAYSALPVVGPRVDHHLLQFQSKLWKQIAKYPCSYLRLGYLSQSRTIFQESLIHVVGQWPIGERHLRHQLPVEVIELIEDKADELAEVVARVEANLFKINLTTSRGERVTPANSYLDWLAVSLWRSWVVERMSPSPPAPPPPPSTTSVRRGHRHSSSISASGAEGNSTASSSYAPPPTTSTPSPSPSLAHTFHLLSHPTLHPSFLTHDDVKKFLRHTPELYTRDGVRRFERRLDEVKRMAGEVVEGSGVGVSELLLGDGGGLAYLTCTRVREEDFLWL